jgi:(1->4)-alpha-D-glucan 1-alpha-D-glucosylmutase
LAVVAGNTLPSGNEEYYLYQTLVGVWPLLQMSDSEYLGFMHRIHIHMEKALREAKV